MAIIIIIEEEKLESLGLWTLSIIRNSKELENTTFRKLDLFLSSGDGRKTPTLFGPLERANLITGHSGG
jgi:hypothetical protein